MSTRFDYVGVKHIQASPGPAPKQIGEHEKGTPGYVIYYPDGYTSWSPKKVFEDAHVKVEALHAESARREAYRYVVDNYGEGQ